MNEPEPLNDFIYDLEDKLNAMRRIRELAGWTQQDIARRLGVDRSAVSRWESGAGRPEFSQLVPLTRLIDSLQLELLQE